MSVLQPIVDEKLLESLWQKGAALHVEGNLADAEKLYRFVLERKPAHMQALNMLGVLSAQTGRADMAEELFREATAAHAADPYSHNNLGIALTSRGHYPEALDSFSRAITLDPGYAEAYSNRGVCAGYLREFAHAFADFDRAIELEATHARARYHRALLCLLCGNWQEGLPLYEWRKRLSPPIGAEQGPLPVWQGEEDLQGKTIIIYAEQGLGDTIQFCRYALLAAERGARVRLRVPPGLCTLLRSLGADIEIISTAASLPLADYQAAMLSLPLAFRSDPRDAPGRVPYIYADPQRIESWRSRLGSHGFKIGVCWHTGPGSGERSFPLALLREFAAVPGVRLISLQKGAGSEQIIGLEQRFGIEQFGEELDGGAQAFLDSAALMQCLDLVISADTAIAHLAGAMARPVWVALPNVPDWRWTLEGSRTLWYETMRLFRQPVRGDWRSVFAEMHRELVRLSGSPAAAARLTIPLAAGALPLSASGFELGRDPREDALIGLLQQGNLAQAENLLRLEDERRGGEPRMSNGLGWIAAAAGLTLPAERYFARAATLAPAWPVPRNNMTLLRAHAHIAPLAPRYLLIKAWGFGFWSEVTHVLGQLLIAELTGRVPVVHWGPNCLFWDGSQSNAFDAYFQSVSDVTPQTLHDVSGSIWPPKWDRHNLLEGAIQQWSGPYSRLAGLYLLGRTEQVLVADFFSSVLEIRPWIPPQSALYNLGVDELYRYLVEKYLRPTAEITAKVQAWYATHLAVAPFLAVHVRGSDKVTEMPDLAAIKGAYETSIEQFRSQFNLRRIFLMTDDARLREELQQAYGEDLISTECRRSASAEGVHYQGGYNRRELGVEVMVDAYLAARASAFIGNGFSNPSLIVSYLRDWPRPRMKLIGPHMFHTRNLTLHRRD